MSELAAWDELIVGKNCPLCAPRERYTEFIYFVKKLSISTIYLSKNQAYRGTVALVFDGSHTVSISQLTEQQWQQFSADIRVTEAAVQQAFTPDHINVESLGNSVPHLHFHLIPRYKSDARWGHPIWTTERKDMPDLRLAEYEYAALAATLNQTTALQLALES